MYTSYAIMEDLPPISLSTEELTKFMISLFTGNPVNYSFTSFINSISSSIIKNEIGFKPKPNTKYSGELCQADQSRVREIIWDMIIDRHLTIGGFGNHDWPNFSVTERGKTHFAKVNEI